MASLVVALALPAPPHTGAPSLAEPQRQHAGMPLDMYSNVILPQHH